ncbi:MULTISPECIES: BA14K family protein [unclassified Bradyrhizobium]|uniref:BA14K family protein n=1 Tax=unclassified Bradyrhizobium TaxID=2631580 RepID=UPI0028E38316|nr:MULTISPECIES: BA14K family protein [unclassified Bradyrhizobium]
MELRNRLPAAILGAVVLSLASPVVAAPLLPTHPAPPSTSHPGEPQGIAYRHWRGGHDWHPGLGRRHGYQYGYRPHHESKGPAVLGSLAAGSAIADSRAQASPSEISCSLRHRSYDARSGTYRGKDGRRHPCGRR